jgi:hypothetical protein
VENLCSTEYKCLIKEEGTNSNGNMQQRKIILGLFSHKTSKLHAENEVAKRNKSRCTDVRMLCKVGFVYLVPDDV